MTGYIKSLYNGIKNLISPTRSSSNNNNPPPPSSLSNNTANNHRRDRFYEEEEEFSLFNHQQSFFGNNNNNHNHFLPVGPRLYQEDYYHHHQPFVKSNHNNHFTSPSELFTPYYLRQPQQQQLPFTNSFGFGSASLSLGLGRSSTNTIGNFCPGSTGRKRSADVAFNCRNNCDYNNQEIQIDEEEDEDDKSRPNKRYFSSSAAAVRLPTAASNSYFRNFNRTSAYFGNNSNISTNMRRSKPLTGFSCAKEFRRPEAKPEVVNIDESDSDEIDIEDDDKVEPVAVSPFRSLQAETPQQKRLYSLGSVPKSETRISTASTKAEKKQSLGPFSLMKGTHIMKSKIEDPCLSKPTSPKPVPGTSKSLTYLNGLSSYFPQAKPRPINVPQAAQLPTSSLISSMKATSNKEMERNTRISDEVEILFQKIVTPEERKSNDPHQINSFELETRHNECRDDIWLKKLVEKYSDSSKHRKSQIEFETQKIAILKTESDLETVIADKIRRNLTITDVIVLEPTPPELPEITEYMQDVITNALKLRNDSEVLVTAFNIQITRADLKTLIPCQWLNDNVINTYMDMIAARSRSDPSLPKVHVFTTFFYPKFLKEGYSNILKRWTRKVDIFSFDLLIFPIHLGVHWCLATADLRKKELHFYDSLHGNHSNALRALLKYLSYEMKERKNSELKTNEWKLDLKRDIPTQENGSDCGVFTCKFAEFLSRDAPLTFKQASMNYYRSRMVYEIIKQDLMFP